MLVVGWRLPPYGVRAKVSSDDGCSWSDWIVLRDDAGTGDIGADTSRGKRTPCCFFCAAWRHSLSQLHVNLRLSIATRTIICQDRLGTIMRKTGKRKQHTQRDTERHRETQRDRVSVVSPQAILGQCCARTARS